MLLFIILLPLYLSEFKHMVCFCFDYWSRQAVCRRKLAAILIKAFRGLSSVFPGKFQESFLNGPRGENLWQYESRLVALCYEFYHIHDVFSAGICNIFMLFRAVVPEIFRATAPVVT